MMTHRSLSYLHLPVRRWPGKNKLGEALMEVRSVLRQEAYEAGYFDGGSGSGGGGSGDGLGVISMEQG